MPDYRSMTAVEISDAVESGEMSALETAKQALAMSVPFGVLEDGRPVGVQIIGPARGELALLQAAAVLERLI